MPTHPYEIDGEKVPSVTQILGMLGWKSYGLMYWAWNLGKEGKDLRDERDRLATAGSLAHAMAAAHVRGEDPEGALFATDPELAAKARASFDAYLRWRASSRLELIGAEVSLVHPTLLYGGTMDAVGMLDGAPAVLDYKSAKALYPDMVCQLAAYGELWSFHHPDLAVKSWHVFRWAEDGSYAHHDISASRIDAAFEAFTLARRLYELKRTIEGKEDRKARRAA
jgi:hypothetical protein